MKCPRQMFGKGIPNEYKSAKCRCSYYYTNATLESDWAENYFFICPEGSYDRKKNYIV